MAESVTIQRYDMVRFLQSKGFERMEFKGVRELVMGKIVDRDLCLRVYTSIEGERSRGNSQDAIRVILAARVGGDVKLIGFDRRVYRVKGWQRNLEDRLNSWRGLLGPVCPQCGALTMHKKSSRFDFWGCVRFPVCRGSAPVRPEPVRLSEYGPPPPYEDEFQQRLAQGEIDFAAPGDIFDGDD